MVLLPEFADILGSTDRPDGTGQHGNRAGGPDTTGISRFAEKHRFDFSAFDLSRSASKQIEREIVRDDTTYSLNTTVKTELDVTIYKAAYTGIFLKRDRSFLGATSGLYIADIGATPSATTIGSGEVFVIEYGDFDGSLRSLRRS